MFNSGLNPISVNRVSFNNSAFSHYLDLPILLAAGEKYSAQIHFTPLEEGAWESSAMVFTDENGFRFARSIYPLVHPVHLSLYTIQLTSLPI